MIPADDVGAAREGAAFFDLSDGYGTIVMTGAEREPFLHALTSNDVIGLAVGSANRQTLLAKKSTIIADFILIKEADRLTILAPREYLQTILNTLETYHFGEAVDFTVAPQAIFQLSGDRIAESISVTGVPAACAPDRVARVTFAGIEAQALSRTFSGDPGWLFICPLAERAALAAAARDAGLRSFDRDLLDILRIEAGELLQGMDFDESTLLLELNLGERIFSLTKGCYPGQEVVARVVNRGRIARLTAGLIGAADAPLSPGMELTRDGKTIGTVRSACWSPTLGKAIAIALLQREIVEQGGRITCESGAATMELTVTTLPFYRSSVFQREAESLYDRGMQRYHAGAFREAKDLFREAIAIDERFADAWEALAMSAEKLGEIEEAIALNRTYAGLDPNAIMAHTNLSRLYMLKGFKDKAEEEKGKATLIEFRLKARHGVQTHRDDASAAIAARETAEKAETERRLGIFRQVLEMDARDEIANFGIGKLFIEQQRFADAARHLRIVIEANPDYSAAYELLASALTKDGEFSAAVDILRNGIDVALRNGDLMPANAMKSLLASLTKTAG